MIRLWCHEPEKALRFSHKVEPCLVFALGIALKLNKRLSKHNPVHGDIPGLLKALKNDRRSLLGYSILERRVERAENYASNFVFGLHSANSVNMGALVARARAIGECDRCHFADHVPIVLGIHLEFFWSRVFECASRFVDVSALHMLHDLLRVRIAFCLLGHCPAPFMLRWFLKRLAWTPTCVRSPQCQR